MVSVIIPNYNHSVFLKKRIDSILTQSYQNFELIILDDCSKDNSRQVIEQYRNHNKVKEIVFNQTNSGSVFKQWEKGINLAKGDYIWIAESDDFAHPMFLEELVPVLDEYPRVGLAYCNSFIVNSSGDIASKTYAEFRNVWLDTFKWNLDYLNEGKKEIVENLLKMCTINNASAVLFRKQALLSEKPFDIQLRYIGDWYCYLKLCLKFDIYYKKDALSYYREHQSNSFKESRNNFAYVKDYFLVFNWIIRAVKFVDKSTILDYFRNHTRQSLIKGWNYKRVSLFKELFIINSYLFYIMIFYNIKEPLLKSNKSKA